MINRNKSRIGDEKLIYDESADVAERASAIFRLAVDGYGEMENFLVELLSHKEEMLRSEAIKVLLGGWGISKFMNNAIDMLSSDLSAFVRSDAAFVLTLFATRFDKGIQQQNIIIKELLIALLSDSDVFVQESCYEYLNKIIKGKDISFDKFNLTKDVDWEMLQPYLNKYNLQKLA